MSKERDIQILEHKIVELETKLKKYNISQKKIDDLMIKKLKYETQLEEIQYS